MLLQLQDINKQFNDHAALRNISLCVEAKERLCLWGSSGGGKSTLIKTINLLEIPNSGKIFFQDKCVFDTSLDDCDKSMYDFKSYSDNIALVLQNGYLFGHMNILANLIFAPVLHGLMDKIAAKDKAMTLLDDLDIHAQAGKMPHELSGGQAQRAAIGRALMLDNPLMLLDEPTSALDPIMMEQVVTILNKYCANKTIIFISHDIGFVTAIATRVITMDDGQITLDQSTKDWHETMMNNQSK